MTPDDAKQMYRDQFALHAEDIFIRRFTGSGVSRTAVDTACRARVVDYRPDELVGSVVQGDRKVIVLVESLLDAGFSLPVTMQDKVYAARFDELAIMGIDDNTRRIAGVLIALDLQVRG